jgi:hypothetical protein
MGECDASEVQRLTRELATVAQDTARLLLCPRYDEAELAELDVRARELRARLVAAARDEHGATAPVVETRNTRGGLVSGG